jgi:hypothetical protein
VVAVAQEIMVAVVLVVEQEQVDLDYLIVLVVFQHLLCLH